ncbi:MAG: hypothetical protein APR53_01640 [Methanoculleus sp. SDB]|nr:MAG: hypothetical protein APR53_01640 [Methanoculleus sp. SDB]
MDLSRTRKIEKIFDEFTHSQHIHEGVVFVENTDGDFSYCKGYGGKELDSPLLMASVTKLFTTTCIFALHEQGRLSLNDKITNYFDTAVLSGLHVYSGKDYSFDLTIADLLCQTSGLPDAYEEGNESLKNRLIREDFCFTFDEIITKTKALHPHFAPRTKGKAYYADINFDMLGEIIEKVTGLGLSDVFAHYIGKPLRFEKTYLPRSENDVIPNVYYHDEALHRPKFILSSRASGGCITTARELMIFIKAFFGGRMFDTAIINRLSASNKLQASLWPLHYGSGYMRIPLTGLSTFFLGKGELLGHSGSTGSFSFYYPLKDLFFAGDLNQMANAALPVKLSMQLALQARNW